MKTKPLFSHSIGAALATTALSAVLVSCAVDGYDDNERFDIGVTGQQLSSPELADSCFTSRVNSDGSESVIVTWKVVYGAGGYECKVYNIDDPSNPIELKKDTVDSPTFIFPKAEDTNYEVYIRTLGNEAKKNTEAKEATAYAYSTLIPAQLIPDGSDIAEFVKANIKDQSDEQAFELAAGGKYTINSPLDFSGHKVTFRGNKVNHPIVTFGAEGCIETSAQLKVKFINFDCAAMTNKCAVIKMSDEPAAEASATAQGIINGKDKKAPNCYILSDPIIVQECAFKDVPYEFFCIGEHPWGISDLRIDNCVIQFNNDGSGYGNGSFISAYSHGYKGPDGNDFYNGCIKGLTIKNSTVYNIVDNSKNYFIRWNNKDIDRIFPTADGTGTFTNNTICRVFSKRNFADRTPNQKKYVITMKGNIWVDVFRLQKYVQRNCDTENVIQSANTIWGLNTTIDGTDKGTLATEEDPGLTIDALSKSLDFSQSNYGLNLTPTGSISSTIGDPRWLTTTAN